MTGPGVPATPERFCPNCGRERTPDASFCPGCGRAFGAMPLVSPTPAEAVAPTHPPDPAQAGEPTPAMVAQPKPRSSAAIGIGILVTALVVGAVVLFMLNSGASIGFSPNTLRCDGTMRTWTMRIPTDVSRITVEMRRDGATGEIISSDSQPVSVFAQYQTSPGNYRIESSGYDDWECRQTPGRYTMILRDADSGRTLASADFSIDD